jgi:S-DNA-T family DNA segregation ATPase FtsK/SpoIIIE
MPRRRKYLKNLFKVNLKKKTVVSLGGLGFILAAGILLLALFDVSKPIALIADEISRFLGFITPLLVVAFTITGLYLLRVKPSLITANTVAGFYLFLFSVLSLGSIMSASRGGIVGRFVTDVLTNFLSTPGGVFVLIVLLFVSVVIFFNTSLETAFSVSGNFITSSASYIKDLWSRKKEEGEEEEPLFATKGMDNGQTGKADETATGMPSEPVTNLRGDQVWEYPPQTLLSETLGTKANRGDVKQNAAIIEKTLDNFGIQARVVEVNMGPAVTQYALEIALGTKLTKITTLSNDIALALSSPNGMVRIEAPIPGKSLVGIEVPNMKPEIVTLKSILASAQMHNSKSKLVLGLGLDVSGNPVVADLARMPHILVAGATGSGKSVAINAFISTMLFRATPEEIKFILVDPKMVELSQWNGIPHLLTPVITEPEKVLSALKWCLSEMDKRYKLFKEVGARNIDAYNEAAGFQSLPYIVLIIDEFAHLMHFAPVEVEDTITKLAQMSRATGIHMILATQRPSVDVITGLIKANVTARVAFNVTSRVDSQVIIDMPGSEKLLGRGDMLYVPPDVSKPLRIQGVYVSDAETKRLLEFLTKSGVEPQYTEEITTMPVTKMKNTPGGQDELFEEAVRAVVQYDRASASLLQRKLRIGYARAARLLDELEAAGVVGVSDGSKPRDVLVKDPERVFKTKEEPSE